MSQFLPDVYFDHGADAAIEAFGAWVKEHVSDGTRVMLILDRKRQSSVMTFTTEEMPVGERLQMINAAVDAITSHRPDARHGVKKFK